MIKNDALSFGIALELLKGGLKVARRIWRKNEKYIFLVDTWELDFNSELWGKTKSPFIALKTDGKVTAWSPTPEDILADDWVIFE